MFFKVKYSTDVCIKKQKETWLFNFKTELIEIIYRYLDMIFKVHILNCFSYNCLNCVCLMRKICEYTV